MKVIEKTPEELIPYTFVDGLIIGFSIGMGIIAAIVHFWGTV